MKPRSRWAALTVVGALIAGFVIVRNEHDATASREAPPSAEAHSAAAVAKASDLRQNSAANARRRSVVDVPGVHPASTTSSEIVRTRYGTAWAATQQPELAAFRTWTDRYRNAPDGETRTELEAEGLVLAQARRKVISDLLRQDPEKALAVTVPAAVRAEMPAAIAGELEDRVGGVGDYEVMMDETEGRRPRVNAGLSRSVWLNGRRYEAHVYGRRNAQLTQEGASLHGIVLDGHMALHASPVRMLEPGEIVAADSPLLASTSGGLVASASAPGTPATLALAANGRTLVAADSETAMDFEALLVAAEDAAGPKVPSVAVSEAPSSPSVEAPLPPSWTLGLKRILVIRVDFSDRPGTPVNSDSDHALTDADWAALLEGSGGVAPFYAASSYGKVTIAATVAKEIYRMPKPAAYYAVSDYEFLHADARTAAGGLYPEANYDVIAVACSSLADLSIAGNYFHEAAAWAPMGGSRMWLNGRLKARTVAHELGHSYGLSHANLWRTSDGSPFSAEGEIVEYGDVFDSMGGGLGDFNVANKQQLGWLSGPNVVQVTESGTYRIYRFDLAGASPTRPLALKLHRGGRQDYWFGYKKPPPLEGWGITSGLYVWWAGMYGTGTLALDHSPENNLFDIALPFGVEAHDPVGIRFSAAPPVGTGTDEYTEVTVVVETSELVRSPVRGWGDSYSANVPAGLTGVRDIALGPGAMALHEDGTVSVWGDEGFPGCFGAIRALTDVVSLSGGPSNWAAVHRDGSGSFWASGYRVPAPPASFPPAVSRVAFGYAHGLALKVDGTVYAWGDNEFHQCEVPAGLRDVVAIAAADNSSIAVKADGTVVQWGHYWSVPEGVRDVVAIAAGESHAVALRRDGSVVTWGYGAYDYSSPEFTALNDVRTIGAFEKNSFAWRADGSVVSCGPTQAATALLAATGNLPPVTKSCTNGVCAIAMVNDGSPVLTAQPVDRTVASGASVAFTAFALAQPQPRYRWQYRDSVGLAWADVAEGGGYSGTTMPTLVLGAAASGANGRQFRCVVGNSRGTAASRAAILRLTGAPTPDPKAAWRTYFWGTADNVGAAADLADPDGDGKNNLLEYASGSVPTAASASSGAAAGSVTDGAGTHLTLTFNRIADPTLRYAVEASNGLGTWASIWTSTGAQNSEGSITVTDSATVQANARRFLRLKVSY